VSDDREPIDRADCIHIVTGYLAAQDWRLVDPNSLAEQIWQDAGTPDRVELTVKWVQDQTWQRYAVILHEACRDADRDRQNRAWEELLDWLKRRARKFAPDGSEQAALAQSAAIRVQRRLSQAPLRVPQAFWMFALRALRTTWIDEHRREGDKVLSLEELVESQADGEGVSWEEKIPIQEQGERGVEDSVADEQTRRQLRTFFQRHLSTDRQRQVAEAHFLDGLEPKAIAQLMGKRPHEIRMVKARIVHTLKSLPAAERQELLEILDTARDERS